MKKFLSIILAVVMIASLLPATFMTAAAAEQTDLNYVFSHNAHKSSVGNGPASGTSKVSTMFSAVSLDDMDYTVSSGAWGNKGHREDLPGQPAQQANAFGASVAVHYSGDFFNCVFNPATVNSTDGFYNWNSMLSSTSGSPIVLITIEVPVSGTYVPALNASAVKGQAHELFLVKETEDNKNRAAYQIRDTLKLSDRIGTYDASIGGEQSFLEHYLEKGIYYLCIVPSGKGAMSMETLDGQTGMLIRSFHLRVPAEKEKYDASKLGGDGKLTFNLNATAFNIANSITDATTGEKTYYFADSAESVFNYFTELKKIDANTTVPESYTGGLNTWTDQSAEAQAAGKYIPWSLSVARETAAWSRNNGNWYLYFDYQNGGGFWEENYDYLNLNKTDKWAYVKNGLTGTHADRSQVYVNHGTGGLHHQYYERGMYVRDNANGTTSNAYIALQVNVPTPAKYKLDLGVTTNTKKGLHLDVYWAPKGSPLPMTAGDRTNNRIIENVEFPTSFTGSSINIDSSAEIKIEKSGDYYVIFEFYKDANSTFDPTSTKTITFDTWIKTMSLTFVEELEEEVDSELAAKRAAMVLDEGNPDKETLEDKSATINVLARAVGTDEDDNDIADVIDTETVVAGATYTTPAAPEIEGYKFLYWGRGIGTNMRPISTDETATFKASQGANYIAAFYSKVDATDAVVEFYNANGELVDRTRYEDGEEIDIPALPTLTGVGTATGWTMDAGETVIGTEEVIEADGPIMAFFAVYDDEAIEKNIEITASGSTGITGAGTYAFGDVVTLTAPARENGNGYNMFLYWKKNGEIVSFDREYKFNAAVSCNVEAVYAKYGPTSVDALRKIIVSTVGETVVAEFIGCKNALERGLVFDTPEGQYKKAMTTNETSFSMINDIPGAIAKAYAIFADGVIFSK